MKKLLAVLLCLAMMVPALALAEGDGRVHITYSFWGNQTEAESVQVALDAYNAMQDKVFVEPMQIPNEQYTETLVNYAIADQLPDCGMVNENAVLYFARNGVMADVSDMYAGEKLQPMDCITFKDGGTPVGYSSSNEILILYYNKDMFDAANEPYPSADTPYTWDEFVEVAKRLTFDEAGKHPGEEGFNPEKIVQYGAFVNNWTWQMEVWALSNGGAWFSEDGKECLINSPEAIESIQKVADLALVEHVAPLNVIPEDNGIGVGIGSKTVAMTTDGTWRLGTDFPNLGINYGIAPLPVDEGRGHHLHLRPDRRVQGPASAGSLRFRQVVHPGRKQLGRPGAHRNLAAQERIFLQDRGRHQRMAGQRKVSLQQGL